MSNAESFLSSFNKIEAWLKSKTGRQNDFSFTQMIHALRQKNALVKNYHDDLYQFASLRNAIVHTRQNDKVIAQPHDEVVKQIQVIEEILSSPPLVKLSGNMITARENMKLEELLHLIHQNSFSQIPLLDENSHVIEILNTNTISRWLAASIPDDIISIRETRITDLLQHIEYKNNYRFITKNTNLFEAADLFLHHVSKTNHNLDAILITVNGKKNQKPLGIVCIEDIASYQL
jgi:predicted transcriptional regulator